MANACSTSAAMLYDMMFIVCVRQYYATMKRACVVDVPPPLSYSPTSLNASQVCEQVRHVQKNADAVVDVIRHHAAPSVHLQALGVVKQQE